MIMSSQKKIKICGSRRRSQEYHSLKTSEKFSKSKPIVTRRRNHYESSSEQEEVEGDEIDEWMVNINNNKNRGNDKEEADEDEVDEPRNNHILSRKRNNNNRTQLSRKRNNNNHNRSSRTTTQNKSRGRKRKLSEVDCIKITTSSNNNKNNKRRRLSSQKENASLSAAAVTQSYFVENICYNPRLASNLSIVDLDKIKGYEYTLMKEVAAQFKQESATIVFDPSQPFIILAVHPLQMLGLITKRTQWVFNQMKQDDVYGQILDHCNYERDQGIMIVSKPWPKSQEVLKNAICLHLQKQFSVLDMMNLMNYVEIHNSPKWQELIQNEKKECGMMEKVEILLRIFNTMCDFGKIMVTTRILHIFDEEIISVLPFIKKGAVDPLIQKVLDVADPKENMERYKICGYNKEKICKLLVIDDIYYHAYDDIDLFQLDVIDFVLEVSEHEDDVDESKTEYNITYKSGNLKGNEWHKNLKEIYIDHLREEGVEMKMMLIGNEVKNNLLSMIRNKDYRMWIEKRGLSFFYGINDRDKLLDLRRFAHHNEIQQEVIEELKEKDMD